MADVLRTIAASISVIAGKVFMQGHSNDAST